MAVGGGAKFRLQGFRPLCCPPSLGLTLPALRTTVKGRMHQHDQGQRNPRRCHSHRLGCEWGILELRHAPALGSTVFQPPISCLVERVLGRSKNKAM